MVNNTGSELLMIKIYSLIILRNIRDIFLTVAV